MPYSPFTGEIMYIAGSFAPKGWALCNGQQMSVTQNQALFSLLGITYGGDGVSTFKLPDLRGRAMMGAGVSVGQNGTTTTLGAVVGSEQVQLTTTQMPAHSHSIAITNAAATSAVPGGSLTLGAATGAGPNGTFSVNIYTAGLPSPVTAGSAMISNNGGGQGHENRQPFTALNACISLAGIYPPRN